MTKCKVHLFATIIVLIIVAGAEQAESATGETSVVRETAQSQDVEHAAGFVFVDGRYVEVPYVVTAQDGLVKVNEVRVKKLSDWPPKLDSPEKPQIPEDVLKNAKSFDDLIIKDKDDSWTGRMLRWIGRNVNKQEDREKEVTSFYKSLPFVKDAVVQDRADIVITLKNGNTRKVLMLLPPFGPPRTKEDVAKMVEHSAKMLQARLNKGDTYLFFSKGLELSFGRTKSAKDLDLMCQVLASDRSKESKREILRRMAILPEGNDEVIDCLFTDFHVSEQLTRRIGKLREASGIEPRSLEEIPAISPIEAERRAVERELQRSKPKEVSPTKQE